MRDVLAFLGSLLKLEAFSGARTYVAAAGFAGLAVSQFASGNYDAAIASFLAALALVGLHDKPTDPPPQA